MKKIWIILAAVVVVTGLAIAGCSGKKSSPESPDGGNTPAPVDFVSFGAKMFEYHLWQQFPDPCVVGLEDYGLAVTVGRGDYSDPKVYTGEVSWTVYPEGVLKFVKPASSTATVSEDGYMATGLPILVKPVGVGQASVRARDASGNLLRQNFSVEKDEHYDPHGDSSSSSGYKSSGYTSSGYKSSGYTSSGYKSSGYTSSGYKSSGYTSSGYKSSGYTSSGYQSQSSR